MSYAPHSTLSDILENTYLHLVLTLQVVRSRTHRKSQTINFFPGLSGHDRSLLIPSLTSFSSRAPIIVLKCPKVPATLPPPGGTRGREPSSCWMVDLSSINLTESKSSLAKEPLTGTVRLTSLTPDLTQADLSDLSQADGLLPRLFCPGCPALALRRHLLLQVQMTFCLILDSRLQAI